MRNLRNTTRFVNSPSPLCSSELGRALDLPSITKLLISVRNTEEASLIQKAGVDWIDLKEPHAGALGRSSLSEATTVARFLIDHPLRSAALGELLDLSEPIALDFAAHFPFLKVGLSHVQNLVGASWQTRFVSLSTRLRELGSELIPVAYADSSICGAPSLQEVQQVAHRVSASHILIDTFVKDGRGLLDWLSLDELNEVIRTAREFNCGIVLAGSLKIADVPELLKLQPAALAVRGAVCHSDSTQQLQSRTTSIASNKVAEWRRCISN